MQPLHKSSHSCHVCRRKIYSILLRQHAFTTMHSFEVASETILQGQGPGVSVLASERTRLKGSAGETGG